MANVKNFYKTKEFIDIQNEWYAKLRDSGFSDLEWLDKKSGRGQNTPFLRKPLVNFLQTFELSTQNHYILAQSFLTHGNFDTEVDRFLWFMYCEGFSYRQMLPVLQQQMLLKRSVYWVCKRIKYMKVQMVDFTYNNPEGHYYGRSEAIEDEIS